MPLKTRKALKRTGPPKRKTPMRRSGIERRGWNRGIVTSRRPVKSQVREGEYLRNNDALLKRYRRSHQIDEIEAVLNETKDPAWLKQKRNNPFAMKLELHHVLRRPRQKWDLWHNCLMTTQRAHIWCHDHFVIPGMIAGMVAKARSVSQSELLEVRRQWDVAYGHDALGTIEGYRNVGQIREWFVPLANELLGMFGMAC